MVLGYKVGSFPPSYNTHE